MNMYSKDMIVGIMLSVGKPEIQIIRDDNSNIGYRVRLMVKLRGREKFVEAVSRTILQHEIKSSVIQQESKSRPAPILKIGGIKNMYRLMVLIHPHLIDKNDLWTPFRKAVGIVSDNKHLTLEGMEELFRIKGLI